MEQTYTYIDAIFKLLQGSQRYLNLIHGTKYAFGDTMEDKGFKTKFTQQELEEINIWDNPAFEI